MIDFSRLFIAICFLVFLVVWVATAFSTKRTVERAGFPWLAVAVFIAIGMFAAHVRHMNVDSADAGAGLLWHPTPLLAIIGDLLALAGLEIMLWARFTLGRNWSALAVLKENHELIESGPYAYVRHPIYSGALLLVLGATIVFGRQASLEILVIVIVAFLFKSRQEEALLTKHFPEAYPEYKKRVRAFIPFLY